MMFKELHELLLNGTLGSLCVRVGTFLSQTYFLEQNIVQCMDPVKFSERILGGFYPLTADRWK